MKKIRKGQILIEILIGIVILALISIAITQMIIASSKGTKSSGQQSIMDSLAQEALEATEAIATSDWHNIYNLTKETQEYYPKIVAGAWSLTNDLADKTVTINSVGYQRWIVIENVMRDPGGNIVANSGTDDPSTQKITVTITASGQQSLIYIRYFSRSRNSTAVQNDWSGGSGQVTNPTNGFDSNFNTLYYSDDGNIDTTDGKLKLLQ